MKRNRAEGAGGSGRTVAFEPASEPNRIRSAAYNESDRMQACREAVRNRTNAYAAMPEIRRKMSEVYERNGRKYGM